jgi:NAD(P)-dependent dehydrogenase (short-subunit alcohol dehydrogenase family)
MARSARIQLDRAAGLHSVLAGEEHIARSRGTRFSFMRPTVLITGATSGMGRYLTTLLAGLDWTVLAHGRDKRKLTELVDAVDGDVQPVQADLSVLAEVHKLARSVRRRTKRLDVLVNNAGVGFGLPDESRELTVDGNELRLAVNYLAPVLLTRLLTPLLVASAPSRVVNVGSLGQVPVDTGDLQMTANYNGTDAYRRAKLALAAFTFDLAEELHDSKVTVNCIHPATFMATTMVLDSGIRPRSTIAEGGDATLRLIVDPTLTNVTGQFFDGEKMVRARPEAYDRNFRSWLRAESDRLLASASAH